jgi:hypothetical protein
VTPRKAIKYTLISGIMLALAGATLLRIGVIPYCTNTVLQTARSPDHKWLAVAEERICNSTFAGPFKIVTVQDTSKQADDIRVLEFEMGGLDDLLSISWSSDKSLEITVSNAITHFATKRASSGPIAINYNTVPARPF